MQWRMRMSGSSKQTEQRRREERERCDQSLYQVVELSTVFKKIK